MKKRRLRAIINNVDVASSEDLLKSKQLVNLVMKETPIAIDDAIDRGVTYATVFEINNSSHYLEIHKKDWVKALDSCLEFFSSEQEEDYEKCVEIKKIREKALYKSNKKTENA